jgi:uncharacterized protein involved in outer membrane biogenesis
VKDPAPPHSAYYQYLLPDYHSRVPVPPSKHRVARLAIIIAFFLIIALMIAKPIASLYVRAKLQQTLSTRLDGDLQLGPLSYSFPLGVHVGSSKLISKDPAGGEFEILGMESFDLALHQLPFRPGPLIIERVSIGHPTVHIIRTNEGFVGIQTGVRHKATDPDRPERKLSEVFQLRHVNLDAGEVRYEDRRREGSVPLVWKGLNIDFGTAPSSGALYAFDLSAVAGQLAALKAKGDFNIDTRDLSLKDSLLTVQAEPSESESPVPAVIQQQLNRYHVKGSLVIQTSANISLRNPKSASFDTKLTLKGAAAQLPNNGVKLDDVDFSIECQRSADSPILAIIFSTTVRAAGATISIEKGTADIDPIKQLFVLNQFDTVIDLGSGTHSGLPPKLERTANTLKPGGKLVVTFAASGPFAKPSFDTLTYEFAAYARDISIKPPGFPEYLTALSGAARSRAGFVTFENCSANYGHDSLHLTAARMPVEYFNRFIHFKEITADVVMRDPHPQYPDALEKIFAILNPRGPFSIAGDVTVDRATGHNKIDYNLQLSSDHATLSPAKFNAPLTNIKSDLTLSPDHITLTDFDAQLCDGRLTASGEVLGRSPRNYQLQLSLRGAQLENIVDALSPNRDKNTKPVTGRCFINAALSGSSDPPAIDPLTTMKGRGDFEIIDGDFWQAPIIRNVADQTSVATEALTVGHAAGLFDVADRKIFLKNAAVSAPVLGIQGSGTVAFDGQLDLRLVAAPLADWREQIKSTRIPILSDIAGEVFGIAQKAINSATKQILYEFHVTGPAGKPKIDAVPAPALTKGAAKLFVGMVRAGKDLNLMDMMKSGEK